MYQFEVCGETLAALPQRALWWPSERALIIADLHLGRAETHASFGLPRSNQIELYDLNRLQNLILDLAPTQLFILGDFIHHARALEADVRERFLSFRERWNFSPIVIVGNHDRAFLEGHAKEWGVERIPHAHVRGPFLFSHDEVPTQEHYNWVGHLHPAWNLSSGPDRIKLPCFWIQKTRGVLPAFSSWAAGVAISAEAKDQVLMTVEDRHILPLRTGPFGC